VIFYFSSVGMGVGCAGFWPNFVNGAGVVFF